MSGLVLPSRANGAVTSPSANGLSNGAAGPSGPVAAGAAAVTGADGGAAPAESAATDAKGKAVAHDEANAIIPGVNGIVPTLQ